MGSACVYDLKRVCEAPFLERAGRLPLGQACKREAERRVGYRDRSPAITGPRDPSQVNDPESSAFRLNSDRDSDLRRWMCRSTPRPAGAARRLLPVAAAPCVSESLFTVGTFETKS